MEVLSFLAKALAVVGIIILVMVILSFLEVWRDRRYHNRKEKEELKTIKETTDHETLLRIAQVTEYAAVYTSALEKITDQAVLIDFAKSISSSLTRSYNVRGIIDIILKRIEFNLPIMIDILENSHNNAVHDSILNKIKKNKDLLEDLIKNSENEDVRSSACFALYGAHDYDEYEDSNCDITMKCKRCGYTKIISHTCDYDSNGYCKICRDYDMRFDKYYNVS